MKNMIRMVALLVSLTMVGVAPAAEDGWQFKLTPYLWALGVDGDIGIGPASVPVDVDFLDAVEDLEMGGMLSGEAHYGPWSLLGDVAYLRLEDDASTALGEFEVEFEQWIVQGAVTYRVVNAEGTLVDLGLGGRYMSMDTDLNTPSEAPDRNACEGWIDPVVVARLRQQFAKNCFGLLYGDIGGFGAASDLTWQLMAAAGYAFNDTVSMLLGYRYLDYDYEDGEFSFDAAESGLVLGLQFKL